MRSFNLAIETRGSWFNVMMPDAFIFNMPMELSLELMTVIGSYGLNSDREFIDHIIYKINGVLLSVFFVNL